MYHSFYNTGSLALYLQGLIIFDLFQPFFFLLRAKLSRKPYLTDLKSFSQFFYSLMMSRIDDSGITVDDREWRS